MTGDKQLDLRPADPFTRIDSKFNQVTLSLKISCKSVQPFSRNVADKETNKQRKKERKKSLENNTPSPYRGPGNKTEMQSVKAVRRDQQSVVENL